MKARKSFVLVAVLLVLLSTWPAVTSAGGTGVPGTISVHKFNDVNANGQKDDGEKGIAGWHIIAYGWDANVQIFKIGEGLTDEHGNITFTCNTPVLKVQVSEEMPECWAPTAPEGMHEWEGRYYVDFFPASFPDVSVDFGNTYTCAPPACETTLIAGQTWDAGVLSVSNDDDNLYVVFDTGDSGWTLGETHLYVGTEPPESSAPGRFPYKYETEYTIPLSSFGGKSTLYIAGHAVVTRGDQEETAWADTYGTRIRERGNWALYFGYTVGEGCFKP